MKNVIIVFMLVFISACSQTQKVTIIESKFAGEWFLNKSKTSYDGKMLISDCTDKQCNLKIYSSQYGHTCGADGIIKIIKNDTAKYYFKYYDASIMFVLMPNKTMNVHYGNTHSWNIFCGMNATLEGIWKKQ